jgi:hypothetical protein
VEFSTEVDHQARRQAFDSPVVLVAWSLWLERNVQE